MPTRCTHHIASHTPVHTPNAIQATETQSWAHRCDCTDACNTDKTIKQKKQTCTRIHRSDYATRQQHVRNAKQDVTTNPNIKTNPNIDPMFARRQQIMRNKTCAAHVFSLNIATNTYAFAHSSYTRPEPTVMTHTHSYAQTRGTSAKDKREDMGCGSATLPTQHQREQTTKRNKTKAYTATCPPRGPPHTENHPRL